MAHHKQNEELDVTQEAKIWIAWVIAFLLLISVINNLPKTQSDANTKASRSQIWKGK